MFGDFAGQILGTIDELAECVNILGHDFPITELRQIQEAATLHSTRPGQSMREMLEEAHVNSLAVIQVHEKQEWFLRQSLQKREGLTA